MLTNPPTTLWAPPWPWWTGLPAPWRWFCKCLNMLVHILHEDNFVHVWKCIHWIWFEKLGLIQAHLHDEHLHVTVELVHLLHEDNFVHVWKCFHWIWLEKLGIKHVDHKVWTASPPTWWAPPWRWYCRMLKTLPLVQVEKLAYLQCRTWKFVIWGMDWLKHFIVQLYFWIKKD